MKLTPQTQSILAKIHDEVYLNIADKISKGEEIQPIVCVPLTMVNARRYFHTNVRLTWDGQYLHLAEPKVQVPMLENFVKAANAVWN